MLRILNGHSLTTKALLYPESMGLNLSERDSTATPNAGPEEPQAAIGEWLQDMDEPGAGIVWRVKTIDRQYDTDTITYNLEHIIRTLADLILPKEVKASDMGGSGDTCTAKQAAQYILGKQSDWVLGDFEYNVSNPYRFSGETLLAALETVSGSLEDPVWEYDFTVYPFKLHIRQQSSDADSELRAGRNITTLKYTIDRSRMYTRFYPVGKNNLRLSGNGYVSRNESTYGRVDKTETDQSKDTEAKLTAWANERLKRHAEPQVTVTISGLDLSESTGESLDKVRISRYKCRVPLPEYGTTILEKVTKLSWRDKIRDRESVTVTLANALADVQSIIREEKARGGGGSRTAAELNEENEILIGNVESGLYTRITQTASELRQEAHDEARSLRSIISQTAESIRLTVESDVGSLRSQIVQTAESIRLEVANEAASLRSEIVQTAESIRSEVADEAASIRSQIVQTAESIRAEVSDESASIRSVITQTAASIRAEVSDESASIRSVITQTAASIRAEVSDESASIRSVITQTAASIRSEITDEASSLRSEITQQAGRIDLVVNGSGASAAIRLSAIVNGINQSQLELSADRIVVDSGGSSQKVKVYIDGAITATEGQITNLKTGVTKATLINADNIVADYLSATVSMYAPSLSIGSGSSGGSGTLYYRGFTFYRQGLTLGGADGSIAEGHFLGDSSTALNIDHYHKIVATEGTGVDAGKIILTLSEPVATSDTTNSKTDFDIAATTAYQNGVLAAKNAVKVNPFTADARTGALNDHRTFTYTTDAPTPSQATPQADTWYLAGGTSWSENKTSVGLHYGSASGTTYATLEISGPEPSDWQLNYDSANYNYKLKCKIGGVWYESGVKTAPNAYDNGWSGAYGTVGISPSTAQSLAPGGSVTVYAQAKATSGAQSKTNVASVTVSAAAIDVQDWQLNYDSANYNYKLKCKINGTWYESGVKTAPNAYDNGWSGAYGTVGISPSTAQTLSAGGSVTIYAQAKATSGAQSKTNVASVTVSAAADPHSVQSNRTTTYTSNGSKTLNPSSGYNVMEKATITVNVPDPDITYPSAATSSSSSGTNDKNYSVSKGYKYHRFKVTAGSKSKTFQITLLDN